MIQFKFSIFAVFLIRRPCLLLKQKELVHLIRPPIGNAVFILNFFSPIFIHNNVSFFFFTVLSFLFNFRLI